MKLTLSVVSIALAAASIANAHFTVDFPAVRGPFVEDNEPQFCDGYTQPANRSQFPLTNGFIVFESEHPTWTVGVLISTAASPSSFNDFHTSSGADQLVVGYFQGTGSSGCINVSPSAAGVQGVQNGANVTLQMVYDGGDGKLYQCMDLTLNQGYQIPSNVTCTSPQGQPPSSSGSPTTTNASPTSTKSSSSGAGAVSTTLNGLLGLSLAGVLATVLM